MRNRLFAFLCALLLAHPSLSGSNNGPSSATDRTTWRQVERLQSAVAGSAAVVADFEDGRSTGRIEALGIAAGDVNGDGVQDLIIAWGDSDSEGYITLLRGNVRAIVPQRAGQSADGMRDLSPFHPELEVYRAPASPNYLVAGDFDGNGLSDLVVAGQDSDTIWLLDSVTHGFKTARARALPGRITFLASGEVNRPDGLSDLVVGLDASGRGIVAVLESPGGLINRDPETFPFDSATEALVIRDLDQDGLGDIAGAFLSSVSVIWGRDRLLSFTEDLRNSVRTAQVHEKSYSRSVQSLAVGDFVEGRNLELAVLLGDGAIEINQCRREVGCQTVREVASGLIRGLSGASFRDRAGASPVLRTARVSARAKDDLIISGKSLQSIGVVVLGDAPNQAAEFLGAIDTNRALVLPLRLNQDAFDDLVMVSRPSGEVSTILTQEEASFVVNADGNDSDYSHGDGSCDADNSPEIQRCTLRAAIQEGNGGDADSYRISFEIDQLESIANLPAMTKPVTFDGGNVILDGSSANSGPRLQFLGGDSVLQGIRAVGFGSFTFEGHNNRIEANWFGTVDGTTSFGTRGAVQLQDAASSTIGGAALSQGNVFVGISFVEAIQFWGDDNQDNRVQGNYIGTDANGAGGLGTYGGIRIRNATNTIVGGAGARRNIITGARGGSGIHVSSASGVLIQGNRIGTDDAGVEGFEVSSYGIWVVDSSSITVGGTTAELGNVVASSRRHGILISDGAAVLIQGNLIGTNAAGTAALGNGRQGIWLLRETNSDPERPSAVGGTVEGAGNLVSGNATVGVGIGLYDHVEVIGNKVGTDLSGSNPLPNQFSGVAFGSNNHGLIMGNVIAFNGGDGIQIDFDRTDGGRRNRIRENAIYSNGGIGINHCPCDEDDVPAVTPNDAGDLDDGANRLQNYPVLAVVGSTGVSGTLNSRPSSSYQIELFANDRCDESGHGEGQESLGVVSVSTDASGNGAFIYSGAPSGKEITATATDQDGNTSEFSACASPAEQLVYIVNSTGDHGDDNAAMETYDGVCSTGRRANGSDLACNRELEGDCECTLRAAIQESNADGADSRIHFNILPPAGFKTITVETALPVVTAPIEIDGTSQPAHDDQPLIELWGPGVRAVHGLDLRGGNSLVRGLLVNRFDVGIAIRSSGNRILGNYIGVCHGGSANLCQVGQGAFDAAGNTRGIFIFLGKDNLIGGTRPVSDECQDPCNVVSSSSATGVAISEGNQVQGNFIGTDRFGRDRMGNLRGVSVSVQTAEPLTLIGGASPGEGNLISANREEGVLISSIFQEVRIEGNRIGTASDGVRHLGNGKAGISYSGGSRSPKVTVGGTDPGSGNRVAFNQTGIVSDRPIILLSNEIFSNAAQVNLEGAEDRLRMTLTRVTSQPPRGSHAGRTRASWGASVQGAEFPVDEPVIVQLFLSGTVPRCQAVELLGTFFVRRDGQMEKTFLARRSLASGSVPPGEFVTATVTIPNATEGSSPFSVCVPVEEDSDGDHIPDDEEEGDRDNDGIPDSEEPDLASFTAQGKNWTAETSAGALAVAILFGALEGENAIHANGLLDVILEDIGSSPGLTVNAGPEISLQGGEVVVTLTPEPDPSLLPAYVNYGPTPDNAETHAYAFPFDGTTGAEFFFDGASVAQIALHFVDGQRGDHDLTRNGVIVTRGGVLSAASPLLYPIHLSSERLFTGVGTSNFSDRTASFILDFYSDQGELQQSWDNPAFSFIAAAQQEARTATEIFDFSPSEESGGWIRVLTDNADIAGLLLVGGDQQLDGAVPFTRAHDELYYTRLFGSSGFRGRPATNLLSLVHPGRVDPSAPTTPRESRVRLEVLRDGGVIASTERLLEPKTALQGSLEDLMGMAVSVDDATDLLRVTVLEGPGVVGASMIRVDGDRTFIALNASDGSAGSSLYSPQMADLPGGVFTSVKLANLSSQRRNLVLTISGDDGRALAPSEALSLGPNAATVFEASDFQFSGSTRVGSLRVEADGEGIFGDVIFGDPVTARWGAALPLGSEPFQDATFSQVANIPGVLFTGLALFNPGQTSAEVEIQVFSNEGEVTGEATVTLAPGERISRLLSEIVPTTEGQVTGSIRLRSSQGILAQQLFGDFSSTFLSAVPPRVIK